jgi:hypothetical protein
MKKTAVIETCYGPVKVQLLGWCKSLSVYTEKWIVVKIIDNPGYYNNTAYKNGMVLYFEPSELWNKVKSIGKFAQSHLYEGHPDISKLEELIDPPVVHNFGIV